MTEDLQHALERIYQRVGPPDEGGCVLWRGPLANGCPQVFVDGRYLMVRRVVYECQRGPIKRGLYPVMKCRDQRCVAAAHIRLMTPSQIGQLAHAEGRIDSPQRRAAIALGRRRNSQVTAEMAAGIRACRTATEAAQKYPISKSGAARIRRGDAWAEVRGASVFTHRP